MSHQIHELQVISTNFIKALYADFRLPIHPAVTAYANGRYPSIEEILHMLELHRDHEAVIKFANENKDVIQSAKDLTTEEKQRTEQQIQKKDEEDLLGFDAFFNLKSDLDIKFTNPYESIKEVPLLEIERKLSDTLSDLCKEYLNLEIASLKKDGKNAELIIRITPRATLSTWAKEHGTETAPKA